MNKAVTIRRIVSAICAAAGSTAAVPALAQSATQLEEVEVTGTYIRGEGAIGNQVQTIDSAALAASGKATLSEIVRELPLNFAGGVATGDNNRGGQDNTSAGANLTGGSGINLRGLGALSTLVLVDGRRVAASGQFGDFVDISSIPAAAIERVEILPDGASALYGSDAVAGVANIILKKDFEGLQLTGRAGTMTQGGGDEGLISILWGGRSERGRLVAGYEYSDRGRVRAEDRDFNGGDLSDRGGINWPIYTSRAGTAANIFAGGAAFNGAVAWSVPQGPGTGLTVANLIPAANGMGNSFDPWAGWDILPAMERHSVFVNADLDVSERVNLRARARYTNRSGDYRTGYEDVFSSLPNTSPYYIAGVSNNFGVLIDDQLTHRQVAADSFAAELGASVELGRDWQVDITVSYSREEQERLSQQLRDTNIGDRVLSGPSTAAAPSSLACSLMGLTTANIGSIATPTTAQQYCAALNYAAYNPYSTEPLSEAVLNQLLGFEDLSFNSWVRQVTVLADGPLFSLPAGQVKLAVGADYREEFIDGQLNFNFRSIRPMNVPYGATDREMKAVFAEVAVPIAESLDLSLAVRHEQSRGLGDFDSTDPKFGIRWRPLQSVTLRASYGTSFHAPPMRFAYNGAQPVPGGNAIFYANAFYSAPCNTTLVQLNGFSGTPGSPTGNCTFTGMVVSGGAGPILKPEDAKTWSVGLELQPVQLPDLRLSVNYYHLKVDNRIVRITSGTLGGILSNYFATGSSPYISNLDFDPDDAVVAALFADPRFTGKAGPGPDRTPAQIAGIIYATQTNLASLKTDGFDFNVGYRFDLGDHGDLRLFANGTVVSSYDVQAVAGAPFVNKLGRYESIGNPVRFRSRQGVAWNHGPFEAVATANYTDSYVCESGCYVPGAGGVPGLNSSPVRIGSWVTLDLQLSYDLGGLGGLFEGTRVSASILNAFDEDPPFIDSGRIVTGNAPEPYDGANATINGRAIALTFVKSFGKL